MKYLLVLRLAAIALLVPADTSECERIFSLMNNLKTADRSALGQANLKNIMIWHTMAQDLSYERVPVQAILKEFRAMAGIRGRKAHKPTPPPAYPWQVAAGQSGVSS